MWMLNDFYPLPSFMRVLCLCLIIWILDETRHLMRPYSVAWLETDSGRLQWWKCDYYNNRVRHFWRLFDTPRWAASPSVHLHINKMIKCCFMRCLTHFQCRVIVTSRNICLGGIYEYKSKWNIYIYIFPSDHFDRTSDCQHLCAGWFGVHISPASVWMDGW